MTRLILIHFVDFYVVTLGVFFVQRGKIIRKDSAFLILCKCVLLALFLLLFGALSLVDDIYLLVKWNTIRNRMNNSTNRLMIGAAPR